ncbi:hypothetical protein [Streptomyces sp. NPDC007088]|uniref:hypothetical protein n=1 Tax=Streptomyces sp. NPDC007088 TaxID=3364773 RepID=UPI0036D19E54
MSTDGQRYGGTLPDGATTYSYAFRHQVPEEFVELPEAEAESAEGWRRAMERLMPDADEREREMSASALRAPLPLLEAGGTTLLSALCVGSEEVDGTERLSMGLLAVSVRHSPHGPARRLATAEAIYRSTERTFFDGLPPERLTPLDLPRGKGAQGPQDMVLAVVLPAGPAVMSTSLRSLRLPPVDVGIETPPLAMAALQLVAPAPAGYCVYVTLSTPSVFLLDSYSARLSHIARTLVFDEVAAPVGAVDGRRAASRA